MESFPTSREIDLDNFVLKLTRYYIDQDIELYIKETQRFIKAICPNCDFRIIYNKDTNMITDVNTVHKCTGASHNISLPKIFINRCVYKAFIQQQFTRQGVKRIIDKDLMRTYSFSSKEEVSISNAIKSLKKELGIGMSDGWDFIESFLKKYSDDNGDNLVSLEYNDSRITRFCVKAPYASVIEEFKEKLLFMDGCFIAASYGGCLLVLITITPERKLIPISMCYCSSESKENTLFFLDKNKELLTAGTTIITDHAKAFEEALKLYPVKHGLCLFHLTQKLKNQSREHIEIMAKTDSREIYNLHKRILERDYPSVYKKLKNNLDKYFFYDGAPKRFGYLSSSPIESFNSLILDERRESITKIFDKFIELSERAYSDIRLILRQRFSQLQIQSYLNDSVELPKDVAQACPLWIQHMIEKAQDDKSFDFVPDMSNSRIKVFMRISSFKGFSGIEKYSVNTITGECSCGRTSDYGYPCPHIQKAIGRRSIEFVEDFWNLAKMEGFLKVNFVRTSTHGLLPSTHDIRPEAVLKPGRPKSRYKTFGEVYWQNANKKMLTDAIVSAEVHPKERLLFDYNSGLQSRNELQSNSYLAIRDAARLVNSVMMQQSQNKRDILLTKISTILDARLLSSLKICKKEITQLARYAKSVLSRSPDDEDVKKVYDTLLKQRNSIVDLLLSYTNVYNAFNDVSKLFTHEFRLRKMIDKIALDFDIK